MSMTKNSINEDVEQTKPLWNCKMVQTFCKRVWQYLTKSNTCSAILVFIEGKQKQMYTQRFFLMLIGASLTVQWLRFWAPIIGDMGSIPDEKIKIHMSHGMA